MKWTSLVPLLLWNFCIGLVLAALIPLVIFWALRTVMPAWGPPSNLHTIVAFWILYSAIRIGIQTIRYSEWPTDWYARFPVDYE